MGVVGMSKRSARDVEIGTAQAIAVAPHHGLGQALDADRQPEGAGEVMPGDRHLRDLRPQLSKERGGLLHLLVDVVLGLRMTEAFLHHRDAKAVHALAE